LGEEGEGCGRGCGWCGDAAGESTVMMLEMRGRQEEDTEERVAAGFVGEKRMR